VNLRKIEQEAEKVKLRDRLARDLHDDLASTLGSISLFATSLKNVLKRPPRETSQLVNKIGSLSVEAVDAIGDIVWSVSPEKDTLNNLLVHMRDLASQVCTVSKIPYDVHMRTNTDDVWLSPDVRRNVYLIFKEALNNVVKHSRATSLTVRAGMTGNVLRMNIEDNGRGFRYGGEMERGHGLRNMEKRAKEIKGQLRIESSPGKGTRIAFTKRMT
ncbi:MAG TPA: ATP-binding protein, partial [Bacteroidota bacterium]|nr:ATP-binding protein [Bacteroidota bacterium]